MSLRSLLATILLLLPSLACSDDPDPQGDTGSSQVTGTGDGTADDTAAPGAPMYCPGVSEWGYPVCRTNDDCQEFAQCVAAPDDCPGAGCPGDCLNDGQCADAFGEGIGGVCTFPNGGCCASQGECTPLCDQTGCAADETCEPNGHCTPIPCDGGYACPEGLACDPGSGADRHGCAVIPCDQDGALPCGPASECTAGACQPIACGSDADCPCGSCIQELCRERPFVCDEGSA